MIHRPSPRSARAKRAFIFALPLLGVLCMPAGTDAAPAKSKRVAAPVRGLLLKGEGVCTLRATFNRGSSNMSGRPFASIGRDDGVIKMIVSKSNTAFGVELFGPNASVVTNLAQGRHEGDVGPPRDEDDVNSGKIETAQARAERLKLRSAAIKIEFGSYGGFFKGQTIRVTQLKDLAARPPFCYIDYIDEVRVEGRTLVNGRGQRIRSGKNVLRKWIAQSGTFRVQSVDADKITFSLQNVRFTAPAQVESAFFNQPNTGRGSFVMQATGQSTFNETN